MTTGIGPAERAVLYACARRRAQECGIGSPVARDASLDWEVLLDAAAHHGVTDLLLAPLASGTLAVPPAILAQLEQHAVEVTGLNLNRTTELVQLLSVLSEHGIPALAYKGPTLAVGAYGHLSRRHSNDLDIFANRQDVAKIRALLIAEGYVVPPRAPRRGGSLLYGLFPMAGRDDVLLPGRPWQTMVDVHVTFASWQFGIRLDSRSLFDRATTVEIAGQRIPTFAPDDLLLILSIHGMMHCWELLRLVSDIDAVASLVTDWDAVVRRAEVAGMRRVLWVALLLAKHLLGTALPTPVATRASADVKAQEIATGAVQRMFDTDAGLGRNRRAWLRSFLDEPHRRWGFVVRDTIHEWFLIWPWNIRPRRRTATRG